MSILSELADGIEALTLGLADAIDDPADRLRLLAALAGYQTPSDAAGIPVAGVTADLCRRTAAIALARATVDYQPTSADEAEAVIDLVGGILQREATLAAGQGETPVYQALRALRQAVITDLTTRAVDLARIRDVTLPNSIPAVAVAYRLYEDGGRGDEVAGFARARHPLFLPPAFRAPSK